MAYEVAIDVLLITGIAWFVISQVVLPLLRGSRLFPHFSRPAHSVQDEIAQVEQEIATERLRHELAHKREELQREQRVEQTKGQDSNGTAHVN